MYSLSDHCHNDVMHSGNVINIDVVRQDQCNERQITFVYIYHSHIISVFLTVLNIFLQ